MLKLDAGPGIELSVFYGRLPTAWVQLSTLLFYGCLLTAWVQ